MAFPDEILFEDEETVINVRPHWLQVVAPGFWLLGTSLVWVGGLVLVWAIADSVDPPLGWQVRLLSWLCVVLGTSPLLVLAWRRILYWLYTRYAVTNRRLIIRTGVLRRHNRDVPLFKIQDVHLDQGIVARLAQAGDMMIEAAGAAGAIDLPWVPEAEKTRRTVHQLAEISRQRQREDSV